MFLLTIPLSLQPTPNQGNFLFIHMSETPNATSLPYVKKMLHIGGILEVNPAFYTKPSHVLIVGATHSLRISWWNPGHRWSPGVPGVPGVGWNRAQRLSDSECSSRCWRFAKFTSKPCLRLLYCCFVIGKLGNCSNSCYGFILMAN